MLLPTPSPSSDISMWVKEHLGDLCCDNPVASVRFKGGQVTADRALEQLDLTGYASRRNNVLPKEMRGASALSPFIRYGLISLPEAWAAVQMAPPKDRTKFRDELAWQEFARHAYARLGARLSSALRFAPARAKEVWDSPWPSDMNCIDFCKQELEDSGWLVNQTRMWMSSQWTVRAGGEWKAGEEHFFTHLLDGSRAANQLGWQWTVGSGTGKPYGFSRWQVNKRAPELCRHCSLRSDCPIQDWPPDAAPLDRVETEPLIRADPDCTTTGGPIEPKRQSEPDAVWLTAESLGDNDPALRGHSDLPAVFVFDEPLLRKLQLSGKRLIFIAETLAELSTRRSVEVRRGHVAQELNGRRVAVTHAPVPGFLRRSAEVLPSVVHPWRWLWRPHGGPIGSYTAWRKQLPARPK